MKNLAVTLVALLSCLIALAFLAAEKDADGCKNHPLIPRLEGFYIAGCDGHDGNADFDGPKGPIHVEGKSTAIVFMPQPDAKQKPAEAKLKAEFESAMVKLGAVRFGATPGQKWPVYKLAKEGKEYWVVLMVDSGEYFTGSYAVRVIEKKG